MLTPHCPLPAELRLSSESEDLTPSTASFSRTAQQEINDALASANGRLMLEAGKMRSALRMVDDWLGWLAKTQGFDAEQIRSHETLRIVVRAALKDEESGR